MVLPFFVQFLNFTSTVSKWHIPWSNLRFLYFFFASSFNNVNSWRNLPTWCQYFPEHLHRPKHNLSELIVRPIQCFSHFPDVHFEYQAKVNLSSFGLSAKSPLLSPLWSIGIVRLPNRPEVARFICSFSLAVISLYIMGLHQRLKPLLKFPFFQFPNRDEASSSLWASARINGKSGSLPWNPSGIDLFGSDYFQKFHLPLFS